MSEEKTNSRLLIIIVFVLVAIGYIIGFFLYMEHKQKTEYYQGQAQAAIDKIEKLEKNLKGFFISLENTRDKYRLEREDLSSTVGYIKKDIKEWEKKYMTAISELREEIEDLKINRLTRMVENLEDEIVKFKMKVQDIDLKLNEGTSADIDLGKISVKQEKKIKRER